MYPWTFFWAPRFEFPWSGDVAQRIQPRTNWFSDTIKPGAGDPRIEEQAVGVASYGKQLGIITEVLIGIAEQMGPQSSEIEKSLRRLKEIESKINGIKNDVNVDLFEEIVARAARLQSHDPKKFRELHHRLSSMFDDKSPPQRNSYDP